MNGPSFLFVSPEITSISVVNQKIEDYLSRYKFALSNDQKKFLIEECTENILKKIEIDSKL